jgi:hypothetical protein
MARVQNPLLFSDYFRISPAELAQAGLINPFLNVDTQLFIDPILLEKSANPLIQKDATAAFSKHFSNVVRLLAICKAEGDPAWIGAQRLLNLHEPPQNGLGYGGSSTSGSSRPDEVRDAILRTTRQIIDLGSSDPEMISLMGFFEEDVGPDTISDFTTRAIVEQLAQLTNEFCRSHNIPVKKGSASQNFDLPYFVMSNKKEKGIVLVPRDIVRDLPVVQSWGDLNRAIEASRQIKARVLVVINYGDLGDMYQAVD